MSKVLVTGATDILKTALIEALSGGTVVVSGDETGVTSRVSTLEPSPFDSPYDVPRDSPLADYRNAPKKGRGTAAAKRAAKKKRNRK